MSYLSRPRLAFAGQFQADISTVNNDVRHFDVATFEERFQAFQVSAPIYNAPANPATEVLWNGWFSPNGTGAFRLLDVRVSQVVGADGPLEGDPALGLYLASQDGRTAAKLVDIDPQWQLASGIWGLKVVLTDGTTEYMTGEFWPAAFRELNFQRSAGSSGGDSFASAKFTSTLQNVRFTEAAAASETLMALRAAAQGNGDQLTINLMTFGYNGNSKSGQFTLGLVRGTLSTYAAGDPLSFVTGRRFAPVPAAQGAAQNAFGVGFFDGIVTEDTALVSVDLSCALPLAAERGPLADIGSLTLAVLTKPDKVGDGDKPEITPALTEGQKVTEGEDFVAIGAIGYRAPGWLEATGGIVDLALPAAARDLIADHPLALVGPGSANGTDTVIVVRETYGGFFTRADNFVRRVDTKSSGPVTCTTDVYAVQWGKRLPHAVLNMKLLPKATGQGGTGFPDELGKPKAPIPPNGVPADALCFDGHPTTGPNGVCEFVVSATNPGNPRGYIDGQIYNISVQKAATGLSAQPPFEPMVLHVRDAVDWDGQPPTFERIQPILQQYDNLYPVMSRGLFSLSDEQTVIEHADILYFAFSRDITDPNYMPVTRDLSTGNRDMILTYLRPHVRGELPEAHKLASDAPAAGPDAPSSPGPVAAAPPKPSADLLAQLETLSTKPEVSKSMAIRQFMIRGHD